MAFEASDAARPTPQRSTPQRRAVLEVLRRADDHPTAAEVYERVRSHRPGIGAATVYRTLAWLVSSGQALELSLGDGHAARYDAHTRRHDHVVCDVCARAVDVRSDVDTATLENVAAATGFAVCSYSITYRGLCPQCSAAGATEGSGSAAQPSGLPATASRHLEPVPSIHLREGASHAEA